MKSGFVALIGRPNVGKSTLLNAIIGKKIAITSSKPQTTRNIIQGIYHDTDTQIVFVDTPGIHKPNHKLGQVLNKQAYYSIDDVDVVCMLIDASEKLGPGDQYIIEKLKTIEKPVLLLMNKIDKISKEALIEKIKEYQQLYDFKEFIPVSALKQNNVEEVIRTVKNYLTDSICYYGENEITNRSLEFLMAELVREKIFQMTEQEVPHSITCITKEVKRKANAWEIFIDIIVDRDSLKKIIIGKQGNRIKHIGMSARKDIEQLIGKKVYLNLFVKTVKNWRNQDKYLMEFGYHDFEK